MPHNLSKAHRQWAGVDVTGRSPLQDRVNKIYAQLMEDLGRFNAERETGANKYAAGRALRAADGRGRTRGGLTSSFSARAKELLSPFG